MDVTKDILHGKQPDLQDPMQRHRTQLTDADIARLNNKREELIVVLRQWHHYSRTKADRIISEWLYSHGGVRSYRAGQIRPKARPYTRSST